ncbi:hypothetical protein [Hafnia alvei]|jgi:hypothetical protein|uniref:hypothetical protein n=1 Tax=Hafnia alvei TaxID=569 RepID=UPI001033DC97|nr:hypothetical protein [Hafnia alvei]MDU3157651.1 hypothetical protein [Hafnia alvei]MEB7888741.1 hypothetical protein [Hafnia alvei]QBJ33530.1 hypothetical protein EYZ02_11865 [Hafnia alvei]TBL47246.1 hypothetical protein EYY99_01605 [Hafnia alvei]TBM16201.1 hypothetical protein EYY84_07230 [Hafnia alvei]
MTSDIISGIFTTTLIFQYLLGLTMLKTTLLSAIFILSGCTASDWISAAGGIMQAKDDHNRSTMDSRIKAANKAAGY